MKPAGCRSSLPLSFCSRNAKVDPTTHKVTQYPPVFTPEEEKALAQLVGEWHARHMALTFPRFFYHVIRAAKTCSDPEAETVKKWIQQGRPGRKWVKSFMERHDLSRRVCDQLDTGRIQITEAEVLTFYTKLQELIDRYPVLHNSQELARRLFNVDEVNMMPDGKQDKVIIPKGSKHSHTMCNIGRWSITVLPCISPGSGTIPPSLLSKAKPGGRDGGVLCRASSQRPP